MAIDRTKISRLAENHMAMGRVDRAIEEFLKLIDDRADDFNLLNRVGDAYLQAGRIPEAVDLFRKAGAGFERGGFNAKATAVFKKAHRIVADDVDISERLAELYRQTNMIKEAIQIHIEVAEICTKKGLLKRALEEFAKVVDLDPKNLKNKVKLADLYNKEGMKDRAANIYLEVAEALALEQMHSEAGQILERAKAMVSTPQVFLTQSRLYVIQKDLVAAAKHLREGLEANPRCAELLDALAEVELQAKAPERALEALGQVPQLAEKSLVLCERALRELARTGKVERALALFKPIGREFARRGLGEAAAKSLQTGLQGSLTAEAWAQLAEIAHQSGNRAEEVDCLRHGFAEAVASQDPATAETISQKLEALGVRVEELAGPFSHTPAAPNQGQAEDLESPVVSLATEQEVIRRMQIQKLQRDASHFMQQRYMDSALESYLKILELDPANMEAIGTIAEIHRQSGMLTKVQMHYVRMAEKLSPLGFRSLAMELLDRAEAMFPGSTRVYRRTLGLLGAAGTGTSVPETVPAPMPVEGLPVIPLELEPREWTRDLVPPPPGSATAAAQTLSTLVPESLLAPPPAAPAAPAMPPAMAGTPTVFGEDYQTRQLPPEAQPDALEISDDLPEISDQTEYEWSEFTDVLGLEGQLAGAPAPQAEPAPAPAIPDELVGILSDIDFQMDYGSPEEAKIEIDNALAGFPGHPELLHRREQAEAALRRMGHEVRHEEEAESAPTFFDLTDVLGDALLETGDGEEMHDATHMMEKIQSIDELFNAFREGVEQQVKGDDYDTHYNLGIAYKEMMLLEPAIEEFKHAMRDPERTLECCSMLAICEQSQGNLDAAVDWLRQGIEAPGFPPEDAIGLRYDLGNLFKAMDRPEEAREQYQLVYDMDPDYGGVAKLLA
jgi:tetratricopeptide (TPR) repeat protein